MFGETSIFGVCKLSPDNKGRICLPSFTSVEKDDVLLVIKEENLLRITKEYEINELIDELEQKIETETNEEMKEILKSKLYNLYESIVKKCIVDMNKRINLGELIEKNTTYKAIGARKELLLKKNED